MKTTKTFKTLGRAEVVYESDYEAGQYFDTNIEIKGHICTIEGNKISEFHELLREIINKYRI